MKAVQWVSYIKVERSRGMMGAKARCLVIILERIVQSRRAMKAPSGKGRQCGLLPMLLFSCTHKVAQKAGDLQEDSSLIL